MDAMDLNRLQHRRLEGLADAIERAERTLVSIVAKPLFSVSWPSIPVSKVAPPRVRVRTRDGRELEFNVTLIDLDRGVMIGSHGRRSSIRLALDDIESVWLRRPRPVRFTMLWLGTIGATALTGATLSATGAVWAWAVLGCLPAGLLAWVLQNWTPMHRWEQIYAAPAA